MEIVLDYVAVLDLPGTVRGATVDVPEGVTAAGLVAHLGVSERHRASVTVFVNDRRVAPSHPLNAGDRIFLSIPFGGG
jgi:sulfur carrier protein ThiS